MVSRKGCNLSGTAGSFILVSKDYCFGTGIFLSARRAYGTDYRPGLQDPGNGC